MCVYHMMAIGNQVQNANVLYDMNNRNHQQVIIKNNIYCKNFPLNNNNKSHNDK